MSSLRLVLILFLGCTCISAVIHHNSDFHLNTSEYHIGKSIWATDMYSYVILSSAEFSMCRKWYHYQGNRWKQITGLISFGVSRTDSIAFMPKLQYDLVLVSPTVNDTGLYVCDGNYKRPKERFRQRQLNMSVVQLIVEGCRETTNTAITMIWFLWIGSFLCLVVDKVRRLKCKEDFILKYCPSITVMQCCIVPTAVGLVNGGTLVFIYSIMSDNCLSRRYLIKCGLGTGLSGLGILVIYLILNVVLTIRLCFGTEIRYQLQNNSEDADEPDEDDTRLKPSVVEDFKSVGPIKGMLSFSATEVFMITSSALYRYDTRPMDVNVEGRRLECYKRFDARLLPNSLAKYEDGLILCSLSVMWYINIKKKTIHRNYMFTISGRPSFVFVDQRADIVYLTYPDKDSLIKTRPLIPSTAFSKLIAKGVLRCPSCVVQNSKNQLIVTDAEEGDVLVFEDNGEVLTNLKPSLPCNLSDHLGRCNKLAIGKDDRIYVAGPRTDHVLEFSADFKFEREIMIGAKTLGNIHSILVHNNELYVALDGEVLVYSLDTGHFYALS